MSKWNKLLSPAGWIERIRQFLVLGEYKGGSLIGMDKAGNRYYEVQDEGGMLPFRNRYVEYARGRAKDASQIPAEWHGWLHSIVDDPPTKVEYQHSVADIGHIDNLSGGEARYAPFNTTKPKLKIFSPSPENSVYNIVLAEKLKKQK